MDEEAEEVAVERLMRADTEGDMLKVVLVDRSLAVPRMAFLLADQ